MQSNYGVDPTSPDEVRVQPLLFSVLLDRVSGPDGAAVGAQWSYTLRANSSDVPWTNRAIDKLTTGYSNPKFFLYFHNHVLTLQWIVENFFIEQAKKERMQGRYLAEAEQPASANSRSLLESAAAPFVAGAASEVAAEKQEAAVAAAAAVASSNSLAADVSAPPIFPPSRLTASWPELSFLYLPVPAHKQDNFASYVQITMGLFLTIAFMWPFSRMVRCMVEEKEKKLSEGVSTTRSQTPSTHVCCSRQSQRAEWPSVLCYL